MGWLQSYKNWQLSYSATRVSGRKETSDTRTAIIKTQNKWSKAQSFLFYTHSSWLQQNTEKYSYSFIFWRLQILLELRRGDARSENYSLFAMYIIWLQTNKGPSQYTTVIDSIWIHCYQSDNLCIMMGLCCGEILSCCCYLLNSQTINTIPCIWRK